MDSILQSVIISAPNFIFAFIAIVMLMYRLRAQDKLVAQLIRRWADCEEDQEKRQSIELVDSKINS